MYGDQTNSTSCYPIEGADLTQQLKHALSRIEGRIIEPELDADAPEMAALEQAQPKDLDASETPDARRGYPG